MENPHLADRWGVEFLDAAGLTSALKAQFFYEDADAERTSICEHETINLYPKNTVGKTMPCLPSSKSP